LLQPSPFQARAQGSKALQKILFKFAEISQVAVDSVYAAPFMIKLLFHSLGSMYRMQKTNAKYLKLVCCKNLDAVPFFIFVI
jgi:hypothetical protein